MKTQSDLKQEEFTKRNGKLFYNFNQIEKTVTEDGETRTFWEAETVEVSSKADAKYVLKEYMLKTTKVTSGITFYTDADSIIDLLSAERKADRLGLPDTFSREWKTPHGVKKVTLADIREAIDLKLSNKGEIVGVGGDL